MTKRKSRAGRPSDIPMTDRGEPVNVILSKRAKESARHLGHGNVSAGIRWALEHCSLRAL